jgi:hypothetical protein
MANAREDEVIRKLRERVRRGAMHGVDISYSVIAPPHELPVAGELRLSGAGAVHARTRNASQEASTSIAQAEIADLLLEISDGVVELVPRSQARFLPDSVIGQVTVVVDGQEASFFFLADPEQAKQQGMVLPEAAVRMVSRLDRLQQRFAAR